jgi:hypothetical protein
MSAFNLTSTLVILVCGGCLFRFQEQIMPFSKKEEPIGVCLLDGNAN